MDTKKKGEDPGKRDAEFQSLPFAQLSPDTRTSMGDEEIRKDKKAYETKRTHISKKTHEAKKEKDELNNFIREDQVQDSDEAKAITSGSLYDIRSQTPALGILAMQTKPKEGPSVESPEPRRATDRHAVHPAFTSVVAMEPMRAAPGAVAVRGDDGDEDSGTIGWGIDGDEGSVKSTATQEDQEQSLGGERLITATLVSDEPTAPIVTATRLRQSLLNDRRVQAAIVIIVLAAVGLVAWAFTRPDVMVTHAPSMAFPSEQPSNSPSFSPGTLVGRFCSQDPYNGYGGDFCPEELPCQPCPSPDDRLSVCLGEGTPIQVLEVYCATALSTRSRPCGDTAPECPLENYCVPCESYTPLGELVGQVCYPPNLSLSQRALAEEGYLQSTVVSDGYALCELIQDGGSFKLPTTSPPPTAPPSTADYFETPVGNFIPPLPSATPLPTATPAVAAKLEALFSSVSTDSGAALSTPGSPQNMAFQTLLADPLLSDYPDDDIIQRYALIVFYYSTAGDQWRSSVGWLDSGDACDWEFIECSTESSVTSIVAPNNLLSGSLPPELHLLDALGKQSLAPPHSFLAECVSMIQLWHLCYSLSRLLYQSTFGRDSSRVEPPFESRYVKFSLNESLLCFHRSSFYLVFHFRSES
jgi:hypothetical protein